MKYLVPTSLWGTAGAQRDVELCSQRGSALAPSIWHLEQVVSLSPGMNPAQGESVDSFSQHKVAVTFLDRK